jgi:hypothetical protein
MDTVEYKIESINQVLRLLDQVTIVGVSNANMIVDAVKILQSPEDPQASAENTVTPEIVEPVE